MSEKLSSFASQKITKGLVAAMTLAGVAGIAHQAALAQVVIQQEGRLAPVEDTYSFEAEAGQIMTIELQSEEFDPILVLKGPSGEVLISNDDYGGTLNSTIVIELSEAGTYSAIASSFSGLGGSYQIEVRPASEYEQVFSRAYNYSISEDFADAVEAYSAAIALDDTDPGAYLGRAESRINLAYINSEIEVTNPSDLPQSTIEAVVSDYQTAADLLEQQGETASAMSLRQEAQFFLGADQTPSTANSPLSRPNPEQDVRPDVPTGPIPVEPDGGIGDGATPIPNESE
ncbi:PPC domain-containing protein [cf. Phormidesmis sp. LEGE 11477]|uniref:PPC domain-containing protein n=1 Tax=cf. Phormidesmis sp. LEGE 11477 TaxID=1828680 RepID=UPI0019FBB2CF|nr:PPC domain-containing protein [cf. Phormidesmis sp. LEGE 11477]MBE9062592.1 pre-peptidase C-terminal domain-containing protein [cf. Phormidesmis sp. LEGE 11477]